MREQSTGKTLRLVLGVAFASTAFTGCGGGSTTNSSALPEDVKAILFLQRAPRNSEGNVFDYTSYEPGGRLVKLEPPSADGTLTVLTSDPMFQDADIQSYDISFDAKSVVLAARTPATGTYQIFSMNVDGTALKQLTGDPSDHVYPIYVPGQKILFMTNATEDGAAAVEATSVPQFRDEYERATTAQVATMNLDGSNITFGARNVSHRVSPALLPSGRVAYTEWRHLGPTNDGHLRQMNADMTGMQEAFGGEDGGNGGTNSYLKARYVQTTNYQLASGEIVPNYQMITVATSRDRTLQSGKLFLVDLNGSEENSKLTDLTPLVPGDREPSAQGVGRYYDAEPVDFDGGGQFLASWSAGPVESEALAIGHSNAQFGIYSIKIDTAKLRAGQELTRFPIFDDPQMWDVLARPLRARPEPPLTTSPVSGTSTVVGALNVYNSSVLNIPAGSVAKVRLLEGFSGEEGGVDMFGTTEFDGQSRYGEIVPKDDGSFAAKVPGNVPFHIQLIDKFAMNIANESIWISGRAGEQRACGGCHESRSATSSIAPGLTQAAIASAVNLDVPRAQRVSTNYSYDTVRGVPWNKAIQPILDAKCISCHDARNTAGVPPYTVTDMTTGTSQTFTFDLTGDKLDVTVGERMTGAYSKSYISIMGLGEILGEDTVMIEGPVPDLVEPGSAKDSEIIQRLNPMQRFPAVDTNVRAFTGSAVTTAHAASHASVPALTADEMYLLILNIDMGGQYFFRENLDEADQY